MCGTLVFKMFHFIGELFHVLIAKPIFNLLILLIALLPGHNLGAAIIAFTVIVRLAMYPLLRKQLHHAMALRKLQPEIKRIKKEAKGDRQRESQLLMELYKEREINPFGSIGIILVQLPILIALYTGISKIIKDPATIISGAYTWVQDLPYMQQLAAQTVRFDETLFGFVDLTRSAIGQQGFYFPAFALVVLSVVIQFYQSKSLMMVDKNARSLRQIFKDTAIGKEVEQAEVQAATSRVTLYMIPFFLFIVSVSLPSALSLYWFVGGLVAFIQQRRILQQDVEEMERIADKKTTKDPSSITEDEVVPDTPNEDDSIAETAPKKKPNQTKSSKKAKKRRR